MALFKQKRGARADTGSDALLSIFDSNSVTADTAMQIPAVARCIDMLSSAVGSLPVKLYRRIDNGSEEIKNDARAHLLNGRTGDTLNASEMRKAWVKDYLLHGNAYAVIDKNIYGEIQRLLYISPLYISVISNRIDPVHKTFDYVINGKKYYSYQFLKILRHSDGFGKGKGIVSENQIALDAAYQMLKFQCSLAKSGGNKRGFLKSEKHLSTEAIEALRTAWHKLYSNSGDGCIVLNDGIDFKEASSTSIEMQLSQMIGLSTNAVYGIFGSADGSLSDETVKNAVMPLLDSFEAAFDSDLLTEKEKDEGYYFAFDTRELTRGDITKRYGAYATALDKGFMQIDEVRMEEDLPPLGIKFVKLNLADSFFDPETKRIYTPNTNQWAEFGENAENILTENQSSDIIEKRANKYHDKLGRFTFAKAKLSKEERWRVSSGITTDHPNYKLYSHHVYDYGDYSYFFQVLEHKEYQFIYKMKICPGNNEEYERLRSLEDKDE